jgi:signal transduction histidine kinase
MNGILGMQDLSFSFLEYEKYSRFLSFHNQWYGLCTIAGMLALLLDTDLSSTQRDYAQTAQVCGKALIALINEVLDRAKIEAGKLELEAVPFHIRSIVDDVLSLFSEKSRNKGIEVSPWETQ